MDQEVGQGLELPGRHLRCLRAMLAADVALVRRLIHFHPSDTADSESCSALQERQVTRVVARLSRAGERLLCVESLHKHHDLSPVLHSSLADPHRDRNLVPLSLARKLGVDLADGHGRTSNARQRAGKEDYGRGF